MSCILDKELFSQSGNNTDLYGFYKHSQWLWDVAYKYHFKICRRRIRTPRAISPAEMMMLLFGPAFFCVKGLTISGSGFWVTFYYFLSSKVATFYLLWLWLMLLFLRLPPKLVFHSRYGGCLVA